MEMSIHISVVKIAFICRVTLSYQVFEAQGRLTLRQKYFVTKILGFSQEYFFRLEITAGRSM
jgi:hypothetical protein